MSNSETYLEIADTLDSRTMKAPDITGRVIVISGPSGVGKGTICGAVQQRLNNVCLSVSATTRARAASEEEGKDYYFLTPEAFRRRVAEGLFLEHAEVFGHLYGTPKDKVDEMLAAGKNVLLEIDVQGGKQARAAYPDAVMIFVLPPDDNTLYTRIRGRGRDSEQSVQTRLAEAHAEIAAAGDHYEHRVVNGDLEEAVDAVVGIIRTATAKG